MIQGNDIVSGGLRWLCLTHQRASRKPGTTRSKVSECHLTDWMESSKLDII